jgi:hypothetical protein
MRWPGLAAVAGALLITGCTAAPGASLPTVEAGADADGPSSSAPVPEAPTPEPGIPVCEAGVAGSVDRTVTAQLEAFAAGDFQSAFALASESFQGSIDLKGFREVIRSGYPEVAASVGHRLVECRQPGPASVSALVAVTGENGVTAQLAYRFVLESAEWRVDGASTLATRAVQTA